MESKEPTCYDGAAAFLTCASIPGLGWKIHEENKRIGGSGQIAHTLRQATEDECEQTQGDRFDIARILQGEYHSKLKFVRSKKM